MSDNITQASPKSEAISKEPLSERELFAYRAYVKLEIFRKIREVLSKAKERGFTQKNLAEKLGIDPGQLSRQLKGECDLRLETLSDLARGLDCRLDVSLTSINQEECTHSVDQEAGFSAWKRHSTCLLHSGLFYTNSYKRNAWKVISDKTIYVVFFYGHGHAEKTEYSTPKVQNFGFWMTDIQSAVSLPVLGMDNYLTEANCG